MTRHGVSRGALSAAGIILLGTAVMHGTGYRPLMDQLAGSGVGPEWLAGVKGLWLIFSLHLSIVGLLFLAAVARPAWAGKGILAIAGLVPAGDTLMLLAFVGIFPGTILLGLATVLVYVGLALRASPAGATPAIP